MEDPIGKKAILVVEDNATLATLVTELLNSEPDYQAVSVGNGAEALDIVHQVNFNLILLDYQLPGLTGLEIYN